MQISGKVITLEVLCNDAMSLINPLTVGAAYIRVFIYVKDKM